MLRLMQRIVPADLVLACMPHTAFAADVSPEIMMAECRARAGTALKMRLPDIDTKYEGQRVDGTHAVNGTASNDRGTRTFQCSFNKSGRKQTMEKERATRSLDQPGQPVGQSSAPARR